MHRALTVTAVGLVFGACTDDPVLDKVPTETRTLSVRVGGSGDGLVTSEPAGIDCGDDCTETFDIGTTVRLRAVERTGVRFLEWTGACSGGSECVVELNDDETVIAIFERGVALDVATVGEGMVWTQDRTIDCGDTCRAIVPIGTPITLEATAMDGWAFDTWEGECSGDDVCRLSMDDDRMVTAHFVPTVRVELAGSGSGSVLSMPDGITCGDDCVAPFAPDTLVTLVATPDPDSLFIGFSGDCEGADCTLTVDGPKVVTATFLTAANLRVETVGLGAGRVTSPNVPIDCGANCEARLANGEPIVLEATPEPGSLFLGWEGPCTGTLACTFELDGDTVVTARFDRAARLEVTVAGPGDGVVESADGQIACPPTCAADYPSGSVVALTATPNVPSLFDAWTGDCTGYGDCDLTLDVDRSVTAEMVLGGNHLGDAQIGGPELEGGQGIALASNGDSFIAGYHYGTTTSGTQSYVSAGGADAVVGRFGRTGGRQWVGTFGDTGTEKPRAIAASATDVLTIVGYYQGTGSFGGKPSSSTAGTRAPSRDVFVTRLDGTGTFLWSADWGGPGHDAAHDVAVDAAGNAIVVGYFEGTMNVGTTMLGSAGGYDVFVASIGPSHAVNWAVSFGGSGNDIALGVDVTNAGDIVVGGTFASGAIDFGGGAMARQGTNSAFIVALDSTGSHQWSTSMGGNGVAVATSVAFGPNGDVVAGGYLEGQNIGLGGTARFAAVGQRDGFVARYDGSTGAHQWERVWTDDGWGKITGVDVDRIGNVIAVGHYMTSLAPLATYGSLDAHVTKLHPDGVDFWSNSFGGTDWDEPTAVIVDPTNRDVVVTGSFSKTVDFGGGNRMSNGDEDTFFVRYGP